MTDATSINTYEKNGINQSVANYFQSVIGQDIHTLECMLHDTEIYFSHVKSAIERKTKGPGAKQDGALLNTIKTIQNPSINVLIPRKS